MTYREKIMQEQNHLEWLRNPDFWAYWPIQPVKRRRADGDFPDCGIVIASVEGQLALQACGVCVPVVHDVLLLGAADALEQPHKTFKYESIEAMLADGWEVD